MKLRLLVLLFSMCVFSSSVAKEEKLESSIPFIIEPRYKYKNMTSQVLDESSAESVVNVHLNQIRDLIRDAQKACCSAIPDGHFKVWIKLDASGKVLGIGADGESGVEVSFGCKK
ncbi:MAG: hypothetical protein RLZ35_484 [Pseudomonadota bacterium]|jgi:hypothetical protein